MNRKELHKVKSLGHLKLAVIVFGLSIVDIVLTQITLNSGGYESNPIMRYLLGQFGWGAWAIKLVAIATAIIIFLWHAPEYPHLAKMVFIALIVFISTICIFNTIQLIIV